VNEFFNAEQTKQKAQEGNIGSSASDIHMSDYKARTSKPIADGKVFAKENEDELHDLAVIEAHMAGVAINVEQPVAIGQKVEVRNIDNESLEDLDKEDDDLDIDELREEADSEVDEQ
jgi:hypothetical protein